MDSAEQKAASHSHCTDPATVQQATLKTSIQCRKLAGLSNQH